jgi:beta-glucosidase
MDIFDYETEHTEAVRKNLGECVVLLRYNGAFPLAKPCKIALYGSGARHTVMGGTGSGEINSRSTVSCECGLREAGFEITTSSWLDKYDEIRKAAKSEFLKRIKIEARRARKLAVMYAMGKVCPEPEYDIGTEGEGDAAVYILSRISGEGSDRSYAKGDYLLTDTEKRDITALSKRFSRFMLVLNTGGPIDLSELDDVSNILYLSQLGAQTGNALSDLLLGKTYPSGKLTSSFADGTEYANLGSFGEESKAKYKEGVYVGYRYFDSFGKRPLFPFGFGLSYTEFLVKPLGVSENDGVITVKAAVLNRGTYRGKEVVQVYISSPGGKIDKPYQSLAAFMKTRELAPGESETLDLTFDMRDHASFFADSGEFILEGGSYTVMVGSSSEATVHAATVRLSADITVKKVKHRHPSAPSDDVKPEHPIVERERDADIVIDAISIKDEISYAPSAVNEAAESVCRYLSEKELANLCVGYHKSGLGALSVIGNASPSVAGAAGETTSILKDKGYRSLVLSDGPAGIRISPISYTDKKGSHGVGAGGLPETMKELLPKAVSLLVDRIGNKKAPKGAALEYKYATSLPIGTAIAGSFNTALAESFGNIVGDEMERFGIDIWLAPAMNIHRDIRCGRCFEYYSEDPYLSGMIAGHIAKGVEAHTGRGVCYKHFAANNQETNRYNNDSIVSERALREIYLRSFEVAMRVHKPTAVMTSYNLLNGCHTSSSSALVNGYLRDELGFDGLVMTDWVVSLAMSGGKDAPPQAEAWENISAGTDLMMPGSSRDVKSILRALRRGKLDKGALIKSAARVIALLDHIPNKESDKITSEAKVTV